MSRPPPPEIDHPYVFSPTQIDNFELCNRKWAFNKIDGIEEPQSEAQILGLEVHDVLENYLDKAVPIDTDTLAGSIAMSGFEYLPFPKTPGMRIEKWFSIEFGVAAYRGLKDIEIIRPGQVPQVKDHKTTKNFKWQKTSKELKSDTQACIYSADAMLKTGSHVVDLEWIYYRTEGSRKARPTKLKIYEPEVMKTLERVDKTAQKMIHVLKTVNNGMDAEPNFGSCSAFGGCPHRTERCKISATSTLVSLMRQKMKESKRTSRSTSDFLSSLRNRKDKGKEEIKSTSKSENKSENKSKGKKSREEEKPLKSKKDKLVKKNKSKSKSGLLSLKKPSEKSKKIRTGKDEPAINSKEREEESPPIPDPPKAITIKGETFEPYWDEDLWEWDFPQEVKDYKKSKKGKKKDKEKTKTKNKSGKSSKKNGMQEHEESEKPRKSEKTEWEQVASEEQLLGIFDMLLEAVAERVAEKLQDNRE